MRPLEVVTTILKIDEKYIAYNTKKFWGTINLVESRYKFIRHPNAIAVAHTHPNPPTSPKPTKYADYKAASRIKLPNIVVSRGEIWVVMPNEQSYKVLTGEWWNRK